MKIDLIAVNRLGRTSENAMTRDFCERASVQGRSLALGPVDLTEVEPRKSGKDAEGEVILAAAEGAFRHDLVAKIVEAPPPPHPYPAGPLKAGLSKPF